MATTVQPASGESTKPLINYRVDAGVAVIELCDPPANTYTYEMNRQLDEAILKARMDNDVHVIVLTGAGDKFFSAGANIKMLASVDPTFKYYFCLHANETAAAAGAHAEAGDRGAERALRGRRAGDCDGGRHPHRAAGRGQDRLAGGESGRAARHRRHAAAVAAGGQEQGHRADGHRQHVFFRGSDGDGNHQRHL